MKRLLLFFASSLFLLVFNLPSVYACSGGDEYPVPTVDTMLEGAVLVRGRVIENSGGNSVIEVERYLQGSGSRYLFLYRQSPTWFIRSSVRGYDFGCAYAESAVAEVGTRAYFSLGRSNMGSYGISSYGQEEMFWIMNDEVYYWETVDGVAEQRFASVDEFEALIAEQTGNTGTVPDERSPMPRFRVLNIQTESGQSYQLPLDRDEIYPIEINHNPCVENCTIISPDGSLYLNPIPNESNAYWAWYQSRSADDDWSDGIGEGESLRYPSEIHAQSILFSPNSDYLLAWYEGSIGLYFVNDRGSSGMYGNMPTVEEVWSARVAVTETMTADTFTGLAAWSGNSNAFAYWDADGLKWLDINMMRVPRLILQDEGENIRGFAQGAGSESIPPLLELSTTGRYLRYGDRSEWMLLDILSGTEFDDMLVSPDEMSFVSIAPEVPPYASINAEEGECAMFDLAGNCLMVNQARYDFCLLPMATCSYSINLYDYQLRELYWEGNTSLAYLACESSESNLCFMRQTYLERPGYYPERPDSFETNAFAYEDYYGYMAWATDDYYLRLSANSYRSDVLDFSAVLDSPIVSLEWGAPLWYLGEGN